MTLSFIERRLPSFSDSQKGHWYFNEEHYSQDDCNSNEDLAPIEASYCAIHLVEKILSIQENRPLGARGCDVGIVGQDQLQGRFRY